MSDAQPSEPTQPSTQPEDALGRLRAEADQQLAGLRDLERQLREELDQLRVS